MKINLLTVSYNEEKMLPFFLRWYEQLCDKIVIFDNGSTDKTVEIAKSHPKVELGDFSKYGSIDEYDENVMLKIRDNAWKKNRNCDWQIICDIDEFLYHPKLLKELKKYQEKNITIPNIESYQMNSEEFPEDNGQQIIDLVQKGFLAGSYMNKKIIFNPNKINSMNYQFGCHSCKPSGEIKIDGKLFMLHYQVLGFKYYTDKIKKRYFRLGKKYKDSCEIEKQLRETIIFSQSNEFKNLYRQNRYDVINKIKGELNVKST